MIRKKDIREVAQALKGQPCTWHTVRNMPYFEWRTLCEERHNKGERQKRCPDCGLYFWEEEMGKRMDLFKKWPIEAVPDCIRAIAVIWGDAMDLSFGDTVKLARDILEATEKLVSDKTNSLTQQVSDLKITRDTINQLNGRLSEELRIANEKKSTKDL